ncbi:type II secretion system F family protein [uncultured Methanobrevibacter sp.]|uniref:type II secretion system F family protein n=1 Tax=uncultured Methanobrevibacter sp. TaxID=253161 RepID=UPI0025EE63B1|nr:type II secretion system F family protein [uncultured Methanobrevibacter sp.]
MLNRFFILIGDLALSSISSIKNFSFKNTDKENQEKNNEKIHNIFSRLNLEVESKTSSQDVTFLDKLREILMKLMLKKSTLILLAVLIVILLIVSPLEVAGIFLTITAMTYIFILYYPQMKNQRNYSDLNQDLPYALRHMSIELKSGKGLHDTLITIRNADYGTFSKELNRVLEEVKFGKSTEDSLLEMSKRVKSEGLTRAVQQLVGTLRVGGNLANSLEVIAEDISFDMQIKLKEYSQKLNSFILIYTFIAILAPVISLIMLMAGSTVMGDIIPSNIVMLIYTVIFPMIVMFMGVFIKKLEPKI